MKWLEKFRKVLAGDAAAKDAAAEEEKKHEAAPAKSQADQKSVPRVDQGFQVSFWNDEKSGKYSHSINARAGDLMYCALVMMEYVGGQNKERVLAACAQLAEAAKMYHSQMDARVLFAGPSCTGILEKDFPQS